MGGEMALIRRIGFTRFSRFGENLGRLDVREAKHTDALDGTDELAITCSDDLAKGDRIVWVDFGGIAHEHIVDSLTRTHDSDGKRLTEATCINSINETWDDYVEDKRPSGTAAVALQSILSGTRWSVGTCDVKSSASHTFYHESVREAIGELLEAWGGELETAITTDGQSVTGRSVGIRALRGDQASPKRFVWTKDLVSVKRLVLSDNPKSRIYGYGKGVETDTGGYGRRLTFGDINGGKDYVDDVEAQALWGHPAADGSVAPSVGTFVDEDCEDAAVLLQETKDYLSSVKEPKVSYDANVIDLYAFGRDWERVETGDSVAIIDRGFTDDGKGIRLQGRVIKTERDLLTGRAAVTFGNLTDQLTDMWSSVAQSMRSSSSARSTYDAAASASPGWLSHLVNALNGQFNNAGTYRVDGFALGSIYSNVPLDTATGLPLKATSGMWAVNISGAGIRLASSLASDGTWDWHTFITGSQVVADCINAGTMRADRIRAGLLTDEGGANYWNLDTGDFKLSSSAKVPASNGRETLSNASAPNITPFFEAKPSLAYWLGTDSHMTWLADGWVHIGIDNSAGTSSYTCAFSPRISESIKPGTLYTMLVEIAQSSHSGSQSTLFLADASNAQQLGASAASLALPDTNGTAIRRAKLKTLPSMGNAVCLARIRISVPAGAKLSLDLRLSLYEGVYEGPHKNYASDAQMVSNISEQKANSAVGAYDKYLTQKEVFNKLTNGGKSQGIYMSNGDLYINGSYIKSGTILADYIRAGTLSDSRNKNSIDLDTGGIVTTGLVAKDINASGTFTAGTAKDGMRLTPSGDIEGYENGRRIGKVNFKGHFVWVDGPNKGQKHNGLQLSSETATRIVSPYLCVSTSSDESAIATAGYTGTIEQQIISNITPNGSGGINWVYGTLRLKFINGILVGYSTVGTY